MKNTRVFMSRESIQKWLTHEKIMLEEDGAHMGFWFHSGSDSGFGLVLTDPPYDGEFHINSEGQVSMHIEDIHGNTIFDVNNERQVVSERDAKIAYDTFKKKVMENRD